MFSLLVRIGVDFRVDLRSEAIPLIVAEASLIASAPFRSDQKQAANTIVIEFLW